MNTQQIEQTKLAVKAENLLRAKKRDPKLIALKQKYEVQYLRRVTGATIQQIEEAVAAVGRGRKKVVAKLIEMGVVNDMDIL